MTDRKPAMKTAGIALLVLVHSTGAWAQGGERKVPWPSAHATPPPPPAFLDTTDNRILEERPPVSAEKAAALKELEQEVDAFTRLGGAYRDAMDNMIKREYVRQRRDTEQRFIAEIRVEEQLEDEARLRAIEAFERFVERYPDDPNYTPDAMFRLGELYFERDVIAQQVEMEAYLEARDKAMDSGESADNLIEPDKNFDATVDLYRRLIETFPDYERADGVYYLIGYCLNEVAEPEEARLAWLNLVCHNYEALGIEHDSTPPEGEADPREEQHPALGLDKVAPTVEEGAFVDVYKACKPAVEDTKFFAETWLRIGEFHFDFDYTEQGLNRAISAYLKVLDKPEDRNYNLALYKVAWAYYRANRYPEALDHFWRLVQWSDDERKRTGRSGSDLREEAIQYLGIGFAYDDWNENQVSDPDEGLPRGIVRMQDPNLMPQDRPWTSEVYHRVGSIYFDEAKYPQAIEVWMLSLKRWPLHPKAPDIMDQIATAFTRHNMAEESAQTRMALRNYGEGTDWWNANHDHPVEQRRAKQLAEDAQINTAVSHHQNAQRLRRHCVEEQNLDLCTEAQSEYAIAAQAYRGYIDYYPNNPEAYELQFNLADALYWSEAYDEAAKEYASVRDSNLDDEYLSISARLVVESVKRLVDSKLDSGELEKRAEPPTPTGAPPRVSPVDMPPLLQRLASAREMYIARVDDQHDVEKVRESYSYNNTLLLYLYGYWDLARERYYNIYASRCKGEKADETGQLAWLTLRNIAVSLSQTEEVRRLGVDLEQRACTFRADGKEGGPVDCKKEENKDMPACVAGADLTNLRYRDAVAIFTKAEATKGDDQRLYYEQAATELIKAVNDEPDHPQAPLALEKAAIALERTSRFESAGRLYQRIIDEVGPRKPKDDEEKKQLDAILANAYFRLAYNSNRFFDFDRAVENYKVLADSKRFAKTDDKRMVEWREGALINAARILEFQQEYKRAADYYERATKVLKDPAEIRAARYRIAEMAFKLRQWGKAVSEMRKFIGTYESDKEAGELVVQAYWRIAQAREESGNRREYEQALADVVKGYARSGQEPGSYAAEYAASAAFGPIDRSSEHFEKFSIKPGKPATMKEYVDGLIKQIGDGSKEAKQVAEAYNEIVPYKRPKWTIAAFVRQGRIYELLARAVLNAPFVVPKDLQKQMKGLPDYAQDDIKIQVEDTVRQLLDQQVRPIECLGVVRYALAMRAARAGNLDNEYIQEASDRINAYGDERIAECVAEAAAKDPSFTAYQPGEFSRAPRGRTDNITPGLVPPSLAGRGR